MCEINCEKDATFVCKVIYVRLMGQVSFNSV